ncbi:MAG: hypothetical protein KKH61_21080 [Gammaproteobacteria bacterium]|nr:hypothetical protein [Gammaproteobacteria bacterium]
MPYTKHNWVSGETITEALMDHLETQYDEAIRSVLKPADETVNNSAVLQDDDDLKLALLANEKWLVDLFLMFTGDAAADLKIQFTAPAGAVVYWGHIGSGSQLGVKTWGFGDTGNTPFLYLLADVSPMGTAGASVSGARLTALVINGANAGDFQLQWAQNSATVADTKMLAGSCLIAHKLT